jgi:hypothetical protein
MRLSRDSKIVLVLSLLWLIAIGVGLSLVWDYDNRPGKRAAAYTHWPIASHISRQQGKPALVMLVHPRCPCSRASIGELARLMADRVGQVSATVVFIRPHEMAADWEKTDVWRSAAIIPGVDVTADVDGIEARRFGAQTSGQTMLYGADGALLFSGGITAARGHWGDNDGVRIIASLLEKGGVAKKETEVFGCPLFEEALDDISEDACHASYDN